MNSTDDERIKCTRCRVTLPKSDFALKRCGNRLKNCNRCRAVNNKWVAKKKGKELTPPSSTPSSTTSSPPSSPQLSPKEESHQIPQLIVVTRDGRYVYHGSCHGRPTVWITKTPWDDCRTISVRSIDGCLKYSDLNGDDMEVLESDDEDWSKYIVTPVSKEFARLMTMPLF